MTPCPSTVKKKPKCKLEVHGDNMNTNRMSIKEYINSNAHSRRHYLSTQQHPLHMNVNGLTGSQVSPKLSKESVRIRKRGSVGI